MIKHYYIIILLLYKHHCNVYLQLLLPYNFFELLQVGSTIIIQLTNTERLQMGSFILKKHEKYFYIKRVDSYENHQQLFKTRVILSGYLDIKKSKI